jgi:hypothetical protein
MKTPAGQGRAREQENGAGDSRAAPGPRVPLVALRRLAEHVARQRQIRRERIACLATDYSALRSADDLSPSTDLLDAAVLPSTTWPPTAPTSPGLTRWRASPGSRMHQ